MSRRHAHAQGAVRLGGGDVDAQDAGAVLPFHHHRVAAAVIAMLHMPGLCAADIDLSAGMVAP